MIVLPGGFSGGDEPDGSGKFIASFFRNPRIKDAVHEMLKQRDGLMLGICNGFQALIKLGLVPYGEIRDMDDSCPTLTFNLIGRHQSRYCDIRVASVLSPWMLKAQVGDIYTVPISHGEGRFVAPQAILDQTDPKRADRHPVCGRQRRAQYGHRCQPQWFHLCHRGHPSVRMAASSARWDIPNGGIRVLPRTSLVRSSCRCSSPAQNISDKPTDLGYRFGIRGFCRNRPVSDGKERTFYTKKPKCAFFWAGGCNFRSLCYNTFILSLIEVRYD